MNTAPAIDSTNRSEPIGQARQLPSIEELFRDHAPAIASLGTAILGDAAEADDLVQDVFIRALKHIHQLRDVERVRDWLVTIAVRLARSRLKRRKLSRLFLPVQEIDYDRIAARTASSDDKQKIERLFRALDDLSANQRVAWVLRHMEGATVQAVAEKIGWTETTTKRRLAKTHQLICRRLGL